MEEDIVTSKKDRLAFIERDLSIRYNLLRSSYEESCVKKISKWIELIDFICCQIGINYDNSVDTNVKLYGDFSLEDEVDKYNNYKFKLSLYMKVFRLFDKYFCIMNEFPKEFEDIQYWKNDGTEDLEIIKNKNIEVVDCLIEFFDIYYKLNCFFVRFIKPIGDMLKYSQISDDNYKKVLNEFDEFLIDLTEVALYKTDEVIESEDNELLKNIEDRIYWIKSIAYMYRIPVGTELMKLIDEHHDELYDDLDDIDYNKYYGYPDYNDK